MIAPELESRPYTALYCDGLRAAMRELADDQFKVWLALATYADGRGVCFPAIATLARDTGYRVERVIEILDGLAELGWLEFLRRAQRDPVTRSMQPNVYLVNPHVFRTREALEGVDFSLLNVRFRNPFSERNHNNTKNRDREQNQITKPGTTPPTAKPSKKAGRDAAPIPTPAGKAKSEVQDGEKQKRGAPAPDSQQREAQTTAQSASTQPPRLRAAPPSQPDDLSAYSEALPDESAESLAESVRAGLGNISAPNARRLVDVYGQRRVKAAMSLYRRQPAGDVINPAGFVISLLQRRAVDPDKDSAPLEQPAPVAAGDGLKYISGEFGQFVKYYTPESESEQEPTE